MSNQIFVFGSNLAGIHCSGSALSAKQSHGAIEGQGVGPQGNSYAIPTLDRNFRVLTLEEIAPHIWNFCKFADRHKLDIFTVVAIGCGVAGYKPEQIAPMFKEAPENCLLPEGFKSILEIP